jgi:hypothetical protein
MLRWILLAAGVFVVWHMFAGPTDLLAQSHALYGTEVKNPGSFAHSVLLARRMVERGVRFVQIYHNNWDHHGNLVPQRGIALHVAVEMIQKTGPILICQSLCGRPQEVHDVFRSIGPGTHGECQEEQEEPHVRSGSCR